MKHEQLGNAFVLLLSTGAVSEVELGFYNIAAKEYT